MVVVGAAPPADAVTPEAEVVHQLATVAILEVNVVTPEIEATIADTVAANPHTGVVFLVRAVLIPRLVGVMLKPSFKPTISRWTRGMRPISTATAFPSKHLKMSAYLVE